MNSEFNGFAQSPHQLVENVYSQVYQDSMQDMPFCNHQLPVYMTPCILYKGQWVGVLLSPWTLSLLMLPGPNEQWQHRNECDMLAIDINDKSFTFIVNHQDELHQYLAASLLSPVNEIPNAEHGLKLAKDILNQVNSIPLDLKEQVDTSKRRLFTSDNRKNNNKNKPSTSHPSVGTLEGSVNIYDPRKP